MKTTVLLRKVAKTIRDHRMVRPGERVLIACSGGADSIFLAFSLLRLQENLGISLALAHFNHRLREGAAGDEEFVREMAGLWGLPLTAGAADVREYKRRNRMNLEEAGRLLRYDFLERTADGIGARKIATGHTLDDQAETFLMRLFRGAGLTGLSGIVPNLEERIIRPLIQVEKGEILEVLRREGISFREDPSNRDRRFLRNRIRLDILPRLQKDLDGGLIRRLGGTAILLMEDERLLRALAADTLKTHRPRPGFLETAALNKLDRALARRVVREFLRRDCGGLRGKTRADVDSILDMKEGGIIRLHGGVRVRKERGRIRVLSGKTPPPPGSFRRFWDGASSLRIGEAGLLVTSEERERAGAESWVSDNEREVFLDLDRLAFPLDVRSPLGGDLFRPLGAPGRKKLKEAFRERDVPPSERPSRPVFVSGGEIVWVQGLPAGEEFKITPRTRRILHIKVRPLS